MQEPISYASIVPQQAADNSHLRTLSILHYVWGGLVMAGSLLFIIHIVLGVMMLQSPTGFLPTPAGASKLPPPPPPPAFMAWIFIVMGGVMVTFGETLGVLCIVAGRSMATRRRRSLIFVVSVLNCFCLPLGTALGVFTLIVMSRPSVTAMFRPVAIPPPLPV